MSQSLSILSRLFADRKLIKNQTPQKPSQNLKSRTPDRPNLDFGLTFGVHFGIDFHEILDFLIISKNHRNAYIYSILEGLAPSKSHNFSPKFNHKFILFLMPHSERHFLRFWRILAPKLSILGPPWRPAVSKMIPKIAQVTPKNLKKSISRCSLLPTCFQDRVRNAPGHHFFGFF